MTTELLTFGAVTDTGSTCRPSACSLRSIAHRAMTITLWLALVGNAATIAFLWIHNGGITQSTQDLAGLLTSAGRLFGLYGAFLMLLQVVLLSRIPALERRVGFDRLSEWHRRTGMIAILLVVVHGPLIVAGYASTADVSLTNQVSQLLGLYPGMVTALIGTILLTSVVGTSLVIVRCRLRYEVWYLVHLTVYAGIVLAYFHQVQDGIGLIDDPVQRDFWIALYLVPLALLLAFRVAKPAVQATRYRMRVLSVVRESPDVVSITIAGRGVERLDAKGGQFFLWRFLARGLWTQSHPFSLSAAPDRHTLRITVKALGDYSASLAAIRPGTRVFAEGPFGRLTADRQRSHGAVLIGGGIGITPLRALADELVAARHPVTAVHRVGDADGVVFHDELAARGIRAHALIGPRLAPETEAELWPATLQRLVPDIAERDVYLCGPVPMMRAVRTALSALHVPASRIHSEQFSFAAKSK